MKQIAILLLCATGVASAADLLGPAPSPLPSFSPPTFWSGMQAAYGRQQGSIPANSIFMIGDSRTQQMPALAIDARLVNFGIGGDIIAGIDNRVWGYTAMHAGSCTILMGPGFNDMAAFTPYAATTRPNLQGLFSGLRGPLIVVKIIYPNAAIMGLSPSLAPYLAPNIDIANGDDTLGGATFGIVQMAAAYVANGQGTAAVIDLNPTMGVVDATYGHKLNALYDVGDGQHFSAAGEAVVIGAIKSAIAANCP